MKKILMIITAIILSVCSNIMYAQSSYTDEQVYKMGLEEQQKGASDQEIVKKLIQRGVSIDQLRRMQKKYQNQSKGQVSNYRGVMATESKRVRKNESLEKNYEEKEDETKEYNDAINIMFPDSLLNEFENDRLKIFGHDIFNKHDISFESSMNIATPDNYVLGAGDEVYIDIYGTSQRTIQTVVSPEGTIDIENFGPVYVGGKTIAQARSSLNSTLGKRYAGSKIRLTVGQTKTITVQVMGSVVTPGSYTMSAFATVFQALYMAGGVNEVGTLRDIKVYRRNKEITSVDIYDYILNGKLTGNVKLCDNDVIIVGTYNCLVNITGKVKRPMFYEMKPTESVETLIGYAGGFAGDAYRQNVRLTRKNGNRYSIFTIDEFERPNFKVMDGDSLAIDSVLPKFENMVVVKGGVNRPGMYEIGKDINTVRELINRADGLTPKAFGNHAILHRMNEDETLQTISLDINGIMSNEVADVALQNKDVVYILDQQDIHSEETLTIYGEVMNPGVYDFSKNTSIEDFIIQAGGLTDAASVVKVDVSRRIRDSKAMTSNKIIAKTYSFSLSNGLIIDNNEDKFVLEPFDEVYVRKSPGYVKQQHVTISGEVAFPGEYTLNNKAQRLSDLIKLAGGLTNDAYAEGAQLQRVLTYAERVKQQKLLKIINSSDSIDINKVEIGNTKSIGINLAKAIQNEGDDKWDIVLEEGDNIIIPQYRNTVSISGEVMYPTTIAYKSGEGLDYYINNAGGYSQNAKKSRLFLINMNGTVSKAKSKKDIKPGCEIVIPAKKEKQKMSTGEIVSIGTMTASIASIIAVILK